MLVVHGVSPSHTSPQERRNSHLRVPPPLPSCGVLTHSLPFGFPSCSWILEKGEKESVLLGFAPPLTRAGRCGFPALVSWTCGISAFATMQACTATGSDLPVPRYHRTQLVLVGVGRGDANGSAARPSSFDTDRIRIARAHALHETPLRTPERTRVGSTCLASAHLHAPRPSLLPSSSWKRSSAISWLNFVA